MSGRQTTKMGYEHSKIISSIHTFFWCAFINDNGGHSTILHLNLAEQRKVEREKEKEEQKKTRNAILFDII